MLRFTAPAQGSGRPTPPPAARSSERGNADEPFEVNTVPSGEHCLTDATETAAVSARLAGSRLSISAAIGLAAAYCLLFLVQPPESWPVPLRTAMHPPSQWVYHGIDATISVLGLEHSSPQLRGAAYLVVVAGVVPWLAMALIGRGHPRAMGFRRPNRYAWRMGSVGYLIAFPALVWMVNSPGFAGSYLGELRRAGAVSFTLYYLANMLTEHFFLHGLLLALFRYRRRWPHPAPVAVTTSTGLLAALEWLGLAQSTEGTCGWKRCTRWMGLPNGCVPAVLASAALFGLVHLGKDPRELLLSVPGGVALGYIAYRTNTWLTTFFLHVATASTALLMIMAMS